MDSDHIRWARWIETKGLILADMNCQNWSRLSGSSVGFFSRGTTSTGTTAREWDEGKMPDCKERLHRLQITGINKCDSCFSSHDGIGSKTDNVVGQVAIRSSEPLIQYDWVKWCKWWARMRLYDRRWICGSWVTDVTDLGLEEFRKIIGRELCTIVCIDCAPEFSRVFTAVVDGG